MLFSFTEQWLPWIFFQTGKLSFIFILVIWFYRFAVVILADCCCCCCCCFPFLVNFSFEAVQHVVDKQLGKSCAGFQPAAVRIVLNVFRSCAFCVWELFILYRFFFMLGYGLGEVELFALDVWCSTAVLIWRLDQPSWFVVGVSSTFANKPRLSALIDQNCHSFLCN